MGWSVSLRIYILGWGTRHSHECNPQFKCTRVVIERERELGNG